MNSLNGNLPLKIGCMVAFVLLAAVSCWATSESLQLLLPSWPVVMCWVVTICFFFIASWGSKMIMDSLFGYDENRKFHFWVGVLVLIFFWLVCSMPTNTHTFFFRSLISDKVTSDIATTEGYLVQIKDNTVTENLIQKRCAEVQNKVDVKLGELKAEIQNDANPGFGPKSMEIFREFAELLNVAKIEPLTYKGTTSKDREMLYDAYRSKIYILLESRKENIVKEMMPSSDNYRKQAEQNYQDLEQIKQFVSNGDINLENADDIKSVCEQLNESYATIRTYKQFVEFKDEVDEEAYTSPNAVTKVKRMISVFDVWGDYIKGLYKGQGFFFWILLSILVDVAAFIFFDIAFKKKVY